MIEQRLQQLLQASFQACQQAGRLPAGIDCPRVVIEQPKQADHGDLASNLAMTLARPAKQSPKAIAEALIECLPSDPHVTGVRVAGPGFINFDIATSWYIEQLREILDAGDTFGCTDTHKGQACQVEFVSANPTGPLHVGHGRNAVLGDVLGNLLRAVGFNIAKEYYVNDAGVQMQTLGKSLVFRLKELQGESIEFPAECYQGVYIIDLARAVLDQGHWQTLQGQSDEEQYTWCGRYAGEKILEGIKSDLDACGVVLDAFFFETTLHKNNEVAQSIEQLTAAKHLYEHDGALWFRSTAFGDDKDRVVKKSDGHLTYFAADIAYHANKFARGFDYIVNVWGADHAGYVPRMSAVVQALGKPAEALECVLTQMVNLIRDGAMVSMSTRRGEFEPLANLIAEVGSDVARYFYLMRSHNAQLDFDMQLATAKTLENPVFYIQYAHARICSIFAKAAADGHTLDTSTAPSVEALGLPEEALLARLLGEYPHVVAQAADELAPHRLTQYLLQLARKFQSYYTLGKRDNRYRVLGQEAPIVQGKLYLLQCIQNVVRNGLHILGISAPERMDRIEEDVGDE